jgi:hypothetical protein
MPRCLLRRGGGVSVPGCSADFPATLSGQPRAKDGWTYALLQGVDLPLRR